MRLQLIRNATVKLTYGGCTFLIDPAFAPPGTFPPLAGIAANPRVPLPMTIPEIMADVQIVLVSHLHRDHFDQHAADAISAHALMFSQPGDDTRLREMGFSNVTAIDDVLPLGRVMINRVDVRHGRGRVLQDMGPASGFVFQAADEPMLLWCGDTVLFSALAGIIRRLQPEVIVVHASGAVWKHYESKIVMDAAEAVSVCALAPEARVIAAHMEAWDHATVSRAALREAADAAGISPDHLIIPRDGDIVEVHA